MLKFFSRITIRKLNKKASACRNMPDKILNTLSPQAGWNIADIGAGGGFYSFELARRAGEKGRVYAVDTNARFLKYISKYALKKELNISAVRSLPKVPEKSLDLIFCRNAYHHINSRSEYFKSLRAMLKDSGLAAVIEYKKNHSGKAGHFVEKKTIIREMEQAGYHFAGEYDFLPRQSFTTYCRQG